MAKNDGGPAFPFSALSPEGPSVYKDNQGMTLRDYFAAQALPACLQVPQENVAQSAYAIADAMLAEREKGQ